MKKKEVSVREEKGSMIIGQRQEGGKACRNSIDGSVKNSSTNTLIGSPAFHLLFLDLP